MAITLNQTFQVKAPVEDVWAFLLDPHQVVTCMPGAALYDVEGDDTFLGNIKVKVGPITANSLPRSKKCPLPNPATVPSPIWTTPGVG